MQVFDPKTVLFAWKREIKRYSEMHDISRAHFRWLNHSIMISSILCSGIASAATIGIASTHNNSDCKKNDWFIVELSAIGLLSSTLISIHRFMNLSDQQKEHDFYSDMYYNLANEIDMNLALEERDDSSRIFVSLGEFMKHCKARYDM